MAEVPADVHPVAFMQLARVLRPEPETSREVSGEQSVDLIVTVLEGASNLLHQQLLLRGVHAVLAAYPLWMAA